MSKVAIVITDGFTLNPGDLTWNTLHELGALTVYDRTSPEEVIDRCRNAELVLTNKVVFDRQVLEQLPKLRYLGVTATGYNVVDLNAASELGIVVTNVPAYGADSVAQFVFSLLLSMVQPVAHYRDAVRDGAWSKAKDFCFYEHSMQELANLSIGVIGFGAIGRRVVQIALGFGMRVLVNSRTKPADLPSDVEWVSLDDLARRSDVISVHCPLTEENQGFINGDFLSRMKSTAYLINTARGPLVDEAALAQALENGVIAGAAVDVLTTEPATESNLLIAQPNCIVTPHIAWATQAARSRLLHIAVENVRGFLQGSICHQVNS